MHHYMLILLAFCGSYSFITNTPIFKNYKLTKINNMRTQNLNDIIINDLDIYYGQINYMDINDMNKYDENDILEYEKTKKKQKIKYLIRENIKSTIFLRNKGTTISNSSMSKIELRYNREPAIKTGSLVVCNSISCPLLELYFPKLYDKSLLNNISMRDIINISNIDNNSIPDNLGLDYLSMYKKY